MRTLKRNMDKANLQMFAEGDINNVFARTYAAEFKELLKAVFSVQSVFGDFFQGGLEALDGVSDNETAFNVKTSDIPCVMNTQAIGTDKANAAYDDGENVAFGTGPGQDI